MMYLGVLFSLSAIFKKNTEYFSKSITMFYGGGGGVAPRPGQPCFPRFSSEKFLFLIYPYFCIYYLIFITTFELFPRSLFYKFNKVYTGNLSVIGRLSC
jgi:hypothetical protein